MHVTTSRLLYALIIAGGLCCTSYAQLTSVEAKSMSKNSDLIITGKVIEQTSSWNEDKTRIYTQATIQVEEYIKGNNAGNTVTVKYLGGEVGEVGEMYSHMPRFEDKEEVLIFLKKDEKSTNYKVFNGESGKISVIKDPKTGEKVTTSNVSVSSFKAQIKNYINE
jgi:hypothetical protein